MSSLRHSLLPPLTVKHCYILLGYRKLPGVRRESPGRRIPKGELQGTTLPAVESLTKRAAVTHHPDGEYSVFALKQHFQIQPCNFPSLKRRKGSAEVSQLQLFWSSSLFAWTWSESLSQEPWKMGKEEEESGFLPGRFTKPFVLLDCLHTPHTYKEKFLLLFLMQLFFLEILSSWTFVKILVTHGFYIWWSCTPYPVHIGEYITLQTPSNSRVCIFLPKETVYEAGGLAQLGIIPRMG